MSFPLLRRPLLAHSSLPHHSHFCFDHLRKESRAFAAHKLASDITYFFFGEYVSACDPSGTLGRIPTPLESTLLEIPLSVDSKALA